ncbi:hypothetical protein BDY24DRAFT_441208, partial [Mrakia frigida]|uniref:uncharacterized protein n=1 Tax=Mrakia frigida TaxID=29902 RepID=UPI003FCC0EFC
MNAPISSYPGGSIIRVPALTQNETSVLNRLIHSVRTCTRIDLDLDTQERFAELSDGIVRLGVMDLVRYGSLLLRRSSTMRRRGTQTLVLPNELVKARRLSNLVAFRFVPPRSLVHVPSQTSDFRSLSSSCSSFSLRRFSSLLSLAFCPVP